MKVDEGVRRGGRRNDVAAIHVGGQTMADGIEEGPSAIDGGELGTFHGGGLGAIDGGELVAFTAAARRDRELVVFTAADGCDL